MDADECRRRIQGWRLQVFDADVEEDEAPLPAHLKVNPRPLLPDAVLDDMLEERGMALLRRRVSSYRSN